MSDRIKEIVAKRERLAKQRDDIQRDIIDLWRELQETAASEIKAMGLFEAQWIVSDDLCPNYSAHYQVLYCHDTAMIKKVADLAKQYDFKYVPMSPGVTLYWQDASLKLQFDKNTDPRTFVKQNGLKIDFRFYNAKIKELQDVRHKWGYDNWNHFND